MHLTDFIWKPGEIFVFGSNLAGIHGAGAALFAKRNCGAIQGQALGIQGNSYAIPTKNRNMKVLSVAHIKLFVSDFLDFANSNTELVFFLTAVGTGLAGLPHEEIAPLFQGIQENVRYDPRWEPWLGEGSNRFRGA